MRNETERPLGPRRDIGRHACTDPRGHCPHYSHTANLVVAVHVCCHCGATQRVFTARPSEHGPYKPTT